MSIRFLNTAEADAAVEEGIIRLLKEGPFPVYQLAKELRATYGTVQYYIERLMKRGKIYTVKASARRYMALNGQDWLKVVRVEGVLEELNAPIRFRPDEGLKTLEHKAPNVAEVLMLIVTALRRGATLPFHTPPAPNVAAATSSTASTPATVNHLFIRFLTHSTLKPSPPKAN